MQKNVDRYEFYLFFVLVHGAFEGSCHIFGYLGICYIRFFYLLYIFSSQVSYPNPLRIILCQAFYCAVVLGLLSFHFIQTNGMKNWVSSRNTISFYNFTIFFFIQLFIVAPRDVPTPFKNYSVFRASEIKYFDLI